MASAESEQGTSTVTLSVASILADDIIGLSGFYADVFGLEEIVEFRTDVFRGLRLGSVVLGFSPLETYAALGIEKWANATGTKQYLTFEADNTAQVERLTKRATERDARILYGPYETAYESWQSVLADPEENVFRINHFRPSP